MKLPILTLFLGSLLACSKSKDYGYLNSDRRNCAKIDRVTEKLDINYKLLGVVRFDMGERCGTDIEKMLKDTVIAPCQFNINEPEYRISKTYFSKR